MIKPRSDFRTQVAKADMTLKDFSKRASVSYATLIGALTLSQPQRVGGVSELTAWRLARAFAEKVGVTEDEAFERLFEDVEHISPDGRRITQTTV